MSGNCATLVIDELYTKFYVNPNGIQISVILVNQGNYFMKLYKRLKLGMFKKEGSIGFSMFSR